MTCYSPLQGFKNEETGGIVFKPQGGDGVTMEVACGQCLGCRLDRSRMWALRLSHEASLHRDSGGNAFVTLTYRDHYECTERELANEWHVPFNWSLSVPVRDRDGRQVKSSHLQAFMKRLRKARPGQKIKYYAVGEYGSKCKHGIDLDLVQCPMCNVGRPHYHACLFNCSFSDLEPYAVQEGKTRYTSLELQKLWPYGFVDVGEVTPESAGYCARYIMKKITGEPAFDHYTSVDIYGEVTFLQPEFSTMSNGLGAGWYEKYKTDVYPSGTVPVPGGGVSYKVPRYYDEKLRQEDEEEYERVKAERRAFMAENLHEYSRERLEQKFRVKRAQIKTLTRS